MQSVILNDKESRMEKLIKYSNGQWSLVKAAPNIDKGHSVFNMDHVNKIISMKDVGEAKKFAHDVVDSSNAIPRNKLSIKKMINDSKNIKSLALGMSNHILAHPSVGLKVIKEEGELRKANDAGSNFRAAQRLNSIIEKPTAGTPTAGTPTAGTPTAETPTAEAIGQVKHYDKNQLYHVKEKNGGILTENPITMSRIKVWHGDQKELENKNLEIVPLSSNHNPYTNLAPKGDLTCHVTKGGEALTNSPVSIWDIMYGHPEILEEVKNKPPTTKGLKYDFIDAAKNKGINIHPYSNEEAHLPDEESKSESKSAWVPPKYVRPRWEEEDFNPISIVGQKKENDEAKAAKNKFAEELKEKWHVYENGVRVTREPLTQKEIDERGLNTDKHQKRAVFTQVQSAADKKKLEQEEKERQLTSNQRKTYEKFNMLAFIHSNRNLSYPQAAQEFKKLPDEVRQAPFREEDHAGKPYVKDFKADIKYAQLLDKRNAESGARNKANNRRQNEQTRYNRAVEEQNASYGGGSVPQTKSNPNKVTIFNKLDAGEIGEIIKRYSNSNPNGALKPSQDLAINKLKALLEGDKISNDDFAYWRRVINNAKSAAHIYNLMFNAPSVRK